ncbi:succinate dehydrogenase hydrophobic membrane anchor subunit [Prosthecochloris sp. CIB 2401]|uniref:succinate dehydrogenase hydrophobic membrane anchor subunit n=1 Tax=Prosthecochloris sp. CIB 2401 TaxID=1868325 RepID=UPI00080A9E82|nr:succinate dehydrogenase hydrophobic membrane anchor subunit [Prosthecochloris sp. CIB 2401]ANT65994.1 succinate dehydrogenase, hydrophobic membrane anchor protein [Prosthecochloris sp. CIB 2401]
MGTRKQSFSVRARAAGWLWQRLTGVGLVLFLALHFWVQHMPTGFLATAEEYAVIMSEFAAADQRYVEAIAEGKIRDALPAEHVITYDKVSQRLANPLWKGIDVMLLVFAALHGVNGLYNVMGDYLRSSGARKAAFGGAVLLFLAVTVQGVVSIMSAGVR